MSDVQARRLAAGSEGRAGNETGTGPSGIAERELERKLEKSEQTESPGGRTVVGRGRLGGSIRRALESRGLDVTGVGRGFDPESLVGEVDVDLDAPLSEDDE